MVVTQLRGGAFNVVDFEAYMAERGGTGTPGPKGDTGPAGPKGDKGDPGDTGPAGADGATGPAGADGAAGADGQDGAQGIQGVPGVKGDTGDTGPEGPEGPQGIQGVPGNDGAAGADGADGATGPAGADGVGVPAGGSQGHVLRKASGTDFDTEWAAPAGGSEAFPVGSVFIAVVSTNPGTLLGYGTWSAFGAGRMLVGFNAGDADFDTAEETGGAKTSSAVVNHTHAVDVTDPGHAHVEQQNSATTGGLTGWGARDTSTNTAAATSYSTQSATTGITASTANPAGGVASFSLMNPYVVVHLWKRVS